ncbi:glycerophosphodiester phosphodiesterase family protein [Leptospira ilyithenensis]|uniref:Glycerophosphodiester phosphodiesterase n=1 Tax=Leptospira ilyithenensis TaxID=2484901 RepID=A0A4R9LS40_9LEPT|nr:glycerophosphodiester phosphodiesterase family protein [Leptospira ilyithenensis]TGN11629.1 glycerophosphodiester phosphodiesterase [Leptospira ilyithenensis]
MGTSFFRFNSFCIPLAGKNPYKFVFIFVGILFSIFVVVLFRYKQVEPLVAAHRGGTGDYPENTIIALENALKNGADILWVTVQLSKDGIPMLYRPTDLSMLTDGKGAISEFTAEELKTFNAGYTFARTDSLGNTIYPYRDRPVPIPTLEDFLRFIPKSVPMLVDMKQLPVEPLVHGIAKVIDSKNAWQRVRFYSTDALSLYIMKTYYPEAKLFETRDITRNRLLGVSLSGECDTPPPAGTWIGIELDRKLTVIEKFTLGEGRSNIYAQWWTRPAIDCFRSNGDVKIMFFGVNSKEAYEKSLKLGADIIMMDSPSAIKTFRSSSRWKFPEEDNLEMKSLRLFFGPFLRMLINVH